MSNNFLNDIISLAVGENLNVTGPEMSEMEIEMAFGESNALCEEALVGAAEFNGELLMHAIVVSGEGMAANAVEQAKALGYRAKGSVKKVLDSIVKFFKSIMTWFTGVDGDLKKVRAKAKETKKRVEKSTGVIKEDTEIEVVEYQFEKFINEYLGVHLGEKGNISTAIAKIDAGKDETAKVTEAIKVIAALTGHAVDDFQKYLDNFDIAEHKDRRTDFIKGDLKDYSAEVSGTETNLKSFVLKQLTTIESSFNVKFKIQKEIDKLIKALEKTSLDYDKKGGADTKQISALSKGVAVLGKWRQVLIVNYTAVKSAGYKAITLGERVAAMHNKA